MKYALMLALAAAAAWAADPQITYTKEFPGSVPDYVKITLHEDGAATYSEAMDDDEPETFQVEPAAASAIFSLADKLEHFKKPLESGHKVANMGRKTYRWDEGGNATIIQYNHSTESDAVALQDWFERITVCERLLIDLRRTARFDRLGVNDVLLRLQTVWDAKRMVGMAQFLPVLDKVAKGDSYLHMARDRASELADAFRAAGASDKAGNKTAKKAE